MFSRSTILWLACSLLTTVQGIDLGRAKSFAVLGASTVTNTGNTVLTGDLGLSPGTSITGFPPGVFSGTKHAADTSAANAQTDAQAAYNSAAAMKPAQDKTGQDLGGQTLNTGVYSFSSSVGITGNLTLDAKGDSTATFIFQIGSTLTTATSSAVNLINGAQACNVQWNVGSSATLGTYTTFSGIVIAQASITATTGVTVSGNLFALTAAVTLDTNNVQDMCPATSPTTSTSSSAAATATVTKTVTVCPSQSASSPQRVRRAHMGNQ